MNMGDGQLDTTSGREGMLGVRGGVQMAGLNRAVSVGQVGQGSLRNHVTPLSSDFLN